MNINYLMREGVIEYKDTLKAIDIKEAVENAGYEFAGIEFRNDAKTTKESRKR